VNEPVLPVGRRVVLPGRGTTFVREVGGPPGAPTVLLLHGLAASGGLNWLQSFRPLARRYHVVAVDLRGHARGLRARRRFRLADCADDAAALLDVLEIESAIAVGYSMGGPVAQLLWQRHHDRVSGLVFCATSNRFMAGRRERVLFSTAMGAVAGTTRFGGIITQLPVGAARRFSPDGPGPRPRPDSVRRWARAEMQRHDWRMVAEAAHSIGTFDSTAWIGGVDVPTASVVTLRDEAVPRADQLRLNGLVAGATVHELNDSHLACARAPFTRVLLKACVDVSGRIPSGPGDVGPAPGRRGSLVDARSAATRGNSTATPG
jgi:pimeloyl-ACP methyl ester carboxylesterase